MVYRGVKIKLNNGKRGVHLFAENCPSGCYELDVESITGNTTDEKQTNTDTAVQNDNMQSKVKVTISSITPLEFTVKVNGDG